MKLQGSNILGQEQIDLLTTRGGFVAQRFERQSAPN